MRKITILLLLLLAAVGLHAEKNALQVALNNGTKATYIFSAKPAVTFNGENVVIATGEASTSYARADVEAFTFVETTEASVKSVESNVTYRYTGDTFECPCNLIKVYSLQGQLVASGNDTVSLANLGAGVYVVSAANHSIKIIKR